MAANAARVVLFGGICAIIVCWWALAIYFYRFSRTELFDDFPLLGIVALLLPAVVSFEIAVFSSFIFASMLHIVLYLCT